MITRPARYCANCGMRLPPQPSRLRKLTPLIVLALVFAFIVIGALRAHRTYELGDGPKPSRQSRPASPGVDPSRYSWPTPGSGGGWSSSPQPYNSADPRSTMERQSDWYRRNGIPDPAAGLPDGSTTGGYPGQHRFGTWPGRGTGPPGTTSPPVPTPPSPYSPSPYAPPTPPGGPGR